MKVDKFLSNYLKSQAFDAPLKLTIRSVKEEQIGIGDKATRKLVMYFVELEQVLVLNKTNLKFCLNKFGNETDLWAGGKVTLQVQEVFFQGKQEQGLRLTD